MLQATIGNNWQQLSTLKSNYTTTLVQMTMAVLLSNNNDYAIDENRRHIFLSFLTDSVATKVDKFFSHFLDRNAVLFVVPLKLFPDFLS